MRGVMATWELRGPCAVRALRLNGLNGPPRRSSFCVVSWSTERSLHASSTIRFFATGAAGAVHLLRRWYEHTGELEYGEAAIRYLDHLLTFDANEEYEHQTEGLLTGAAGVALILHGVLETEGPQWDLQFLAHAIPSLR